MYVCMCMCAELGKNLDLFVHLAVLAFVVVVCAVAWVCEKSIKSIKTITPTPNGNNIYAVIFTAYFVFVLYTIFHTTTLDDDDYVNDNCSVCLINSNKIPEI